MDMQLQFRCLIVFLIFLLQGCSHSVVKINNTSKIYTIVDKKQTVSLSSLNQDIKKSFYTIKNNRFYAKISFNHSQVLIYFVGLYSKSAISNLSAYHFDSRFHPVTLNHKMRVYDLKVKVINNIALISAKLISTNQGANTGYHQNEKIIELNSVLHQQKKSIILKNEKPFIKKRLLKHFPQFRD